MAESREVELKVGRRATDGTVRLSAYPPQLLQLSVSYKGERSASVLLTHEQIQALRAALDDFIKPAAPQSETTEPWDQTERRTEERFCPTSINLRKGYSKNEYTTFTRTCQSPHGSFFPVA